MTSPSRNPVDHDLQFMIDGIRRWDAALGVGGGMRRC
jgi:hypothetical protein